MLTKRIIACLDIKNGRTVKGVNFVDLRDAGDPVQLAQVYSQQGIDELVFLDISATIENRKTTKKLVAEIAKNINIPFTIGGGIKSQEDVHNLLRSGADKIAINSAAIKRPQLIQELAKVFGSQCIVLAIDARRENGVWKVYKNGGQSATELDLFDWAKTCEELGAGEILFTSMDHDGTKNGFANEAIARLSAQRSIPIIASGGAGEKEHFADTFSKGQADAALAASVFHFGEINIQKLKAYLRRKGLPIRI